MMPSPIAPAPLLIPTARSFPKMLPLPVLPRPAIVPISVSLVFSIIFSTTILTTIKMVTPIVPALIPDINLYFMTIFVVESRLKTVLKNMSILLFHFSSSDLLKSSNSNQLVNL